MSSNAGSEDRKEFSSFGGVGEEVIATLLGSLVAVALLWAAWKRWRGQGEARGEDAQRQEIPGGKGEEKVNLQMMIGHDMSHF